MPRLTIPSGLEITAEMVRNFPVRKGPCDDNSLGYITQVRVTGVSNSRAKTLLIIEALKKGATAIYMVGGSHERTKRGPIFSVYGEAYKPHD